MTPEQHDRVQSMFLAACLLAEADRSRYLDEACGVASEIRREVEALLAYHTANVTANGPTTLRELVGGWTGSTGSVFAEGTVLDGKIRIDAVIGEGGMGTVFRGVQLALERPVAIKIMRPAFLLVPGFIEHLKREALAIARLHHPNVVAIYDLCSSEAVGAYLVMEFIEGETLADARVRVQRMASSDAVAIVGQICAAVQAMHDVGVIHRDLKPQNILLASSSSGPRVKVLDFGIAKLVEGSSAAASGGEGVFVGTPLYSSPEQVYGRSCDARSDVYSLGCILYELLVGHPPFTGHNSKVLLDHTSTRPDPPSSHEPNVASWLDAVVLKALEKDPSLRFQSATDLAEALVAKGQNVDPKPAGERGVGEGPDVAPGPRSVRPPNNLPTPLTSFVGREAIVDEMLAAVDKAPLVTLVGLGGVGKTRLAVRVATELLDRTHGGAGETVFEECRFVDLAPVAAPSDVASAAAATLGVRGNSQQETLDAIARHIGQRRVLLVLDNCEHVVGACSTLLEALFGACPNLAVLATSRVALRLVGERLYTVAPLGLPDAASPRDGSLASEAVRLFVDRARLVSSIFRVEDDDLGAVVDICRHLDGLPLAIELAAARTRILTVHQIRDRLGDRFRLLRATAATGRHESLRAAIDWSYGLLEASEQALFERLSVFSGGFTIDAIEAVCGVDGVDAVDALDILAGLVDKSLVGVAHADRKARYFLLETVREYAATKLAERDAVEQFRQRHHEYYLDLAETAAPELHGKDAAAWGARLQSEIDNLRAALAWARDRSADHLAFLRFAKALHVFFYERGYLAEGRMWIDAALEGAGDAAPVEMRTVALTAVGNFAHDQGDLTAARAYQERALAINRDGGDEACIASVLHNIGNILMITGECARARAHFEESLAICRKLGRTHNIALSLFMQGNVAIETADWARATALLAESDATYASIDYTYGLSLVRTLQAYQAMVCCDFARFDVLAADASSLSTAVDHRLNVASLQAYKANIARHRGQFDQADVQATQALAEFRAIGYKDCLSIALYILARSASGRGALDLAAERLAECIDLWTQQGMPKGLSDCCEEAAAILSARGDTETSARLLGAAHATRERIGCPILPIDAGARAREREAVRSALGGHAFDRAFDDGTRLALPDAAGIARRALAAARMNI